MFRKKPYKGMDVPYRVHRGFLECWKEIEDIIIQRATEMVVDEVNHEAYYRWDKIIIVGYSHGGALAMLCHECIWYHRPDIRHNTKTIAFDGPRVYGWYWIKKALRGRWSNFRLLRNSSDIVTHVPPAIFAYTHVGKVIKIGKDEKWKIFTNHSQSEIKESLNIYEHNEDWETALFE